MGGTRYATAAALIVLAAAGAAFGSLAGAAAAGPGRAGTLDPTFGESGRVFAEMPMETAPSRFVAMAGAPGGRLVLDLRRDTPLTSGVREIEMRLANGTLDPSFGQGGRVGVEDGGGLATLTDGRVLVGVRSCGDDGKPSVIQLDPSGAVSAGFGRRGCGAPLPFEPELVAADTQARTLAVGAIPYCESCSAKGGLPSEVVVARLLSDGGLDPSFGKGGVVHLRADHGIEPTEIGPNPFPRGIAATADGDVIVGAGSSLIRLDGGGNLVTGFGDGGLAALPGNNVVFHLQPDGRVVGASVEGYFEGPLMVSRLGPDGRPDTSFGQGGTTTLPLRSGDATAVVPAPDGGVLIAGSRAGDEGCRCTRAPILARLTASGQPHPAYGAAGIAALPLPPPTGRHRAPANAAALLAATDGSVLVAGQDQNEDAFAIALGPAGDPSPSFAEAGKLVEHHEAPVQLEATGLALGPRGQFAAAARRSTAPGLGSGFLLRFGADGGQRPGAAGTGSVETLAHGQIEPNGGGRLVVWGGEGDRTLRALGPKGEPLRSYGRNGVAKLPPGLTPEAVAPAPGGGVAVIGAIGERAMAVYRLGARGRPVRGFGRAGLARVAYPRGFAIAFDGLVESNGRVVLTGWVDNHVGAARLLPDGRLDPSFGHGGLVRGLLREGAFGLEVAPWGGGVVIATMRKGVETTAEGLVRLDRRGRLVRGFGSRGVVDPLDEYPPLDLLTGAGRIVVVTDPTLERGRRPGVKLRAYRPDGGIDRSFGRGGLAFYGRASPRHAFEPAAAVQQPDGRIVVAGTSRSRSRHTKLTLIRFR